MPRLLDRLWILQRIHTEHSSVRTIGYSSERTIMLRHMGCPAGVEYRDRQSEKAATPSTTHIAILSIAGCARSKLWFVSRADTLQASNKTAQHFPATPLSLSASDWGLESQTSWLRALVPYLNRPIRGRRDFDLVAVLSHGPAGSKWKPLKINWYVSQQMQQKQSSCGNQKPAKSLIWLAFFGSGGGT